MKKSQPQGVGSSDEGLKLWWHNHKVQIPLGTNNFLGPHLQQKPDLTDLCSEGALHGSKVYLSMVDTQSDPALRVQN
jgi:hypothetical protein